MPSLIKLYTDAQKRFISQINHNRGTSWQKSFNSMRAALHQCLKELNPESAVQQYYKLYTVMQECPPENNISAAGAVTELVIESGWLLCSQDMAESGSQIFQSVLVCISTAVMHYDCINLICADHLFERELLSESEAYYQAACEMLINFLEKLYVLKAKHTINLSLLGNEARKLILKRAFLSVEQKKYDEAAGLLSQYDEVSSRHPFNESDEVKSERLREYSDLQGWLTKQRETQAIETEVKRRKKKIKSLPPADKIDKTFDIYLLSELNISLESQKESESCQKILDEISLRQNKVLQKISLINKTSDSILEFILSEAITEEALDIVPPEKKSIKNS